MNFTQMHERLRLELLRRIQRGSLSVSLLARKTGLGQPHLSNFLNGRRQLSLDALDRVLAAQHLTAGDLVPMPSRADPTPADEQGGLVPLVSHATAMFEPYVRASAVQSMIHFPPSALESNSPRALSSRRAWQRFVAVRISAADAAAMDPLVQPEAIVLIDRHYNSLISPGPQRLDVYAVRLGSHLLLRYVDFQHNRLVLRPHSVVAPVVLLEIGLDEMPNDPVVGRVALIQNQF
jgi:transcriptional regulator with XRE-family HTH domain